MSQLDKLRQLAAQGTSIKDICMLLNEPRYRVVAAMKNNKIKNGNDTRFKKGNLSWNKGKSMRLSPATEFKKGQLPHNAKHDGAISIRAGKSGKQYKYIRVGLSKWVLLHRQVYQQHFGTIPPGMLVTFVNGNSLNCEPTNLKLISKRENALRNANRTKASQSLYATWKRERIRKKYGLPPITGFGNRLKTVA